MEDGRENEKKYEEDKRKSKNQHIINEKAYQNTLL